MTDPKSNKSIPQSDSIPSDDSLDSSKKTIANVLGYQISVNSSTKNPILRISLLIFLNILLLVLFRLFLNRV